jgi:porin
MNKPVSLLLLAGLILSAHASAKTRLKAPPLSGRSALRDSQEDLPVAESPEEESSRLSGNWFGARPKLSELGFDLALLYKFEVNRTFRGVKRETVVLDNLDLRLSLDLEKMARLKGATLFFYGMGNHGKNPTEYAGDAQGTSNIETKANGFRLYEAWFQQLLYKDQASILIGLHDLNSEFYTTESSTLFLNSTFGIGKELSQTGENGPSIFPATSPAIRFRAEPSKSFYLQSALFNAQAGDAAHPSGTKIKWNPGKGLLFITEAAYLRGGNEGGKAPGKYALGAWTYTRTFDHIRETVPGTIAPLQANSSGAYVLLEQQVASPLTAFVRYGAATTKTNQYGSSLGAGLVYQGLVPKRPKDRFGIAVARASAGGEHLENQLSLGNRLAKAETAYEFSYRVEVRPGIAVQPDFQIVSHPGLDPQMPAAKVGAIRFELSF